MTIRRPSTPLIALAAVVAAGLLLSPVAVHGQAGDARPIKALLVTGGGYHDYKGHEKILTEGVSARSKVEWTVFHDGSKQDNHKISLFEDPKWADSYDVVVHNECFASVTDPEYVAKVVAPTRTASPASSSIARCTPSAT